ncbi:MAG: hypothetical protein AAB381_02090 [Patescibacteria group bacterium]
MKNTLRHLSIFILALSVYGILSIHSAQATVGGPTYIGSFKYNKADESVYFTQLSLSGRGCPPVLQKISLVSGNIDTAFSCDQGEALYSGNYSDIQPKVLEEISKMISEYKDLTPLNLLKNNIAIDITFNKSETLESDPTWIIHSLFTATVYQNGSKIDEFSIKGCNIEQPFTFAGYMIPGFEKKIVLLSSTKSDCFEGGYTGESLHVVSNVTLIDPTPSNQYKHFESPLVPNEATLIVFEPETLASADGTDPTRRYGTLILAVLLALVVGIYVGKIFFKK